jgi:hypothetical protein
MKHSWPAAIAVALLVVLSAARMSPPVFSADHEPAVTVSVEDIGTKVTLVGRLGEPLGKMMEVKGTWAYPEDPRVKDYSLRFRVSDVNGKRLPKPVEFNVAQVEAATPAGGSAIPKPEGHKALDGVSWTLRAYETGRFDDVPEEYRKDLGTAPPQPPYCQRTFTSQLVGVVQR